MRRFIWLPLVLFSALEGFADRLRFAEEADWQSWQRPQDLVLFEGGALGLRRFHKDINAAADAPLFSHATQKRGPVSGGIWEAKSGAATAERLIDGDVQSAWKPDADDPLDQWSVQIDLGRPVLAREIRLHFADRPGARPLRQFSVFVSAGSRIDALDDLFKFDPLYRTPKPNAQTEVRLPLAYATTDSTYLLDPQRAINRAYESGYRVVQYIIIEVDEKSEDASLAEVEVLAVGDNVSLGTALRGGSFLQGGRTTGAANLFDGDMDSFAILQSAEGGWLDAGIWWRVDLGAVFFIDELFVYFSQRGEGLRSQVQGGNPSAAGGRFLVSDGRMAVGNGLPVPEQVDYDLLVEDRCRPECSGSIFHPRYLFAPRKVRYLFWHEIDDEPQASGWGLEAMLFSDGYPAQVDMRSDFIDLAAVSGDGRPRVIKALHWDAELPEGTRLQLRSRSGNALESVYAFYDRKGEVITQQSWQSLPAVLKGPVDTALVVGEDWDAWSNVYQYTGERFKSASPRRYVQLEMILSTDVPERAPQVRALEVEFEDALLHEAKGRIEPRQAEANAETDFTYTLWPRSIGADSGFDAVRLAVPGVPGAIRFVRMDGVDYADYEVQHRGDSLFVYMAEPVRGDSLQIGLQARLVDDAALFAVDLGLRARPGIWQSVEPASRRAHIVYLPAVPARAHLVGDLRIQPPLCTPNGDGRNDDVEIRFVVYKATATVPTVAIFDLSGRPVATLVGAIDRGEQRYRWDGTDDAGQRVPPGMYLCRIDAGTAAADDTVLRSIAVAY